MKVVSREEWTQARTALLVREKEFSREREALAQARRDLPWEEVDQGLRVRRAGREADPARPVRRLRPARRLPLHVPARRGTPGARTARSGPTASTAIAGPPERASDVTLRRGLPRAASASSTAYQQRMGWSFPWVLAGQTRLQPRLRRLVHARAGRQPRRPSTTTVPSPGTGATARGSSVFARDEQGRVFHTYSTYARGIDADERRLPVPGSGPEGPRRTRGRRPAVLGPPPRRVRFLIPASGCGS